MLGCTVASTSSLQLATGMYYLGVGAVCVVHFNVVLTCFSLRPLDVEFMKRLHNCVNIVPVIAKADTLTIEERDAFKQRVGPCLLFSDGQHTGVGALSIQIRDDIRHYGINIYPAAYGAEDEEDAAANAKIQVLSYSVVG